MLWEGREGAGWEMCSAAGVGCSSRERKKSSEGCAREVSGREKDACCPEGEVGVERLLLKL